jgi:stress response protein YsnF
MMSTNTDPAQIVPGLLVLSRDGETLGEVEGFDGQRLRIAGWAIPVAAIAGVDARGVHLTLARADFVDETATGEAPGTERLVIPLAEERLTVGTREVMIGEIVIRKRVVEEERMVPVTIRREEVEFVRLAPGEPLPAGWGADAGTQITRFPLHGTEPTFEKTAVVNREVVVARGSQTERRDITGTVRREHIEVEERYRQARPQFERDFSAQVAGGRTTVRTFGEVEPQYRMGFSAGQDPRHAGQDFTAVDAGLQDDYDALGHGDNDREAIRHRVRAGFEAARQ